MKISFDFDETLDIGYVQDLAKSLVDAGNDVWVLTSRCGGDVRREDGTVFGYAEHAKDMVEVCEKVGIPLDKVLYTNGAYKYQWVLDHKIDLHFDNMEDEVEKIFLNGGNAMLVTDQWQSIKSRIFRDSISKI
jgi:hypothetical protein